MAEETKEAASEESTHEFSVEDRVKRKDGVGCHGTILDIRSEVTSTKADTDSKGLMVIVKWDNGVQSYFTPASLLPA